MSREDSLDQQLAEEIDALGSWAGIENDRSVSIDPQNFNWTEEFTLTDQQAEKISNPEFLYPNLIIRSHVIAIVAEPNGGKTTIMFHIAGEIAKREYKVFYVNADISGVDAKPLVSIARAHGFSLMLPDMAGKNIDEIIDRLVQMNESNANFSDVVFIFDTLKKMTDVINKTRSKELYKLLRGLSAKGMTIILLAHTNKYTDADGNPVYEGTGDLRSDVDELIYLLPKKGGDGSMTVSTKPDKVRGALEAITFWISPERKVILQQNYVNVAEAKKRQARREKDETVIEAITESIQSGKYRHIQIRDYCKESHGIGWRSVEAVLKRYLYEPEILWTRERSFQNNAWSYYLKSIPPFQAVKANSGEPGETGNSGNTEL